MPPADTMVAIKEERPTKEAIDVVVRTILKRMSMCVVKEGRWVMTEEGSDHSK
jgi:hypothetical protein